MDQIKLKNVIYDAIHSGHAIQFGYTNDQDLSMSQVFNLIKQGAVTLFREKLLDPNETLHSILDRIDVQKTLKIVVGKIWVINIGVEYEEEYTPVYIWKVKKLYKL